MARPLALALLAVAFLATGRDALAQPAAPARPTAPAAPSRPAAPAPTAPAPADASPDAHKEEARAHFEKGVALTRENDWAPALAEFLESRRLFPTRTATQNAALVLQRLQRFDEALDLFETLLRDFPNLPPEDKTQAQLAVIKLRGLVGTIDLDGAELGAEISIDGRDRGDYPPPAPLRVAAGTHVVRVYKEGFEPFEQRVDTAGGEATRVKARLRALTRVGRLKVSEQQGRALDVVVDGVVVGKTPWEGPLSVGQHTVVLRGEGLLGTQPATVPVRGEQLTPLQLRAEDLEGSLRVEPTPAGASIAVDSVSVGLGSWEGRLRRGPHRVEVSAEGFVPQVREVSLAPGRQELVAVELVRDAGSGFSRKLTNLTLETGAAFAVTPSLGGDVAGGCTGSCSRSPVLGGLFWLHGGYRFASGLGLGVSAGYLFASEQTTGRQSPGFVPTGLPASGTANDDLLLSGVLLGATASLHKGQRVPVTLRLGAGALLGTVRDQRNGTFTTTVMPSQYQTGPVVVTPSATYVYLDPEVRVAWVVAPHVEVGVGVQALFLFNLTKPKWDDGLEVFASSDGVGTYGPDALTGSVVVLVVPGIGARYEF
jgi:hypothetical protein